MAASWRAVDSRPGVVEALRRLRKALPGDAGFGDPLSAAGSDGASVVARVADRLFDEQPRASKELGLGALQVWQSLLERTGRGTGSRELTVMFTDLVGFSTWAMGAGDDAALQLLRAVAGVVEPALLAHRGTVVKRLGDGVMATFPTPQLAFDAAVLALERIREVEVAGHRPSMRTGIHTGSPRALGGDYLGVDVNIAARLVEKAAAGQILVSGRTLTGLDPDRIATRRKKTFMFNKVKGVPNDVAVYSVTPT
ncbi:MAG: adenylate/guanylate cyclase domain-containing protein [Mycobacteriales bacterium]